MCNISLREQFYLLITIVCSDFGVDTCPCLGRDIYTIFLWYICHIINVLCMKLKKKLYLREVNGEYIGVMDSELGLDYTKVIQLNETAAYLIEKTETREFAVEDWVALLVEEYEVSVERAEADVLRLIQALRDAHILEE